MKYVILIIKTIIVFLAIVIIANTCYQVDFTKRTWESSLKENPYGFNKENYTCSQFERKTQSNTYKSIYYTYKNQLQTELLIVFLVVALQFLLYLSRKKQRGAKLKILE
jgi:preprotein translocase subunit SecE